MNELYVFGFVAACALIAKGVEALLNQLKEHRRLQWCFRRDCADAARQRLILRADDAERLAREDPAKLVEEAPSLERAIRAQRWEILNHRAQSDIPETFDEAAAECVAVARIVKAIERARLNLRLAAALKQNPEHGDAA